MPGPVIVTGTCQCLYDMLVVGDFDKSHRRLIPEAAYKTKLMC